MVAAASGGEQQCQQDEGVGGGFTSCVCFFKCQLFWRDAVVACLLRAGDDEVRHKAHGGI